MSSLTARRWHQLWPMLLEVLLSAMTQTQQKKSPSAGVLAFVLSPLLGTRTTPVVPSAVVLLLPLAEFLSESKLCSTELARVQGQLYETEKNWNGDDMKKRRDTWKRLARDMEIKSHELRLAEEQVGESNATRVGDQVEQLKAKIQRLITGEQEAKQKQKAAADEIKKLQKDTEEFKNNKDGKIDELK
ncbi:hypothetical protein K435DRAFT_894352, partial [Dendrothele bispora CBS 962.96]